MSDFMPILMKKCKNIQWDSNCRYDVSYIAICHIFQQYYCKYLPTNTTIFKISGTSIKKFLEEKLKNLTIFQMNLNKYQTQETW